MTPPPRLVVDAHHDGTSEQVWTRSDSFRHLPPLELKAWPRAVLVAPHPDDEVLGAGGLMLALLGAGVRVTLIAVTDGEASHPGSPAAQALDLSAVRKAERAQALRQLGADPVMVTELHIPDGAVARHADDLRHAIRASLGPGDVCVAPWSSDGHPDHDASGQAAGAACRSRGASLVSYMIWAWHWATPADLPWQSCRTLSLPPSHRMHKLKAISAYRSQVAPLGPDVRDGPVLSGPVLERFRRSSETFIVEEETSCA